MRNDLKDIVLRVRRHIVEMVHSAQSGHPGGSLGAADIVTYLYFEEMNINESNLDSTNRDRFVLSKGHTSPCLYSVLYERGFLKDDLNSFRQLGSKLQGHPNMHYVKGVDMSTGSLGQGISTAVGMAIANKVDKNDNRVYALCGDGESEEGLVWEAMMAAGHYKLDNFCVIFDVNHLQIDGNVEDVMNPLPLDEKAKAFGFNVVTCNGNDFDDLKKAFDAARACKGKPTCIIANTTKGKGVSFMENNYAWHGAAPDDEKFAIAMNDLKEAK